MNSRSAKVSTSAASIRQEEFSFAFGRADASSTILDQVLPVVTEMMVQENGVRLYTGSSPQVSMRPEILAWLQNTCSEFRLLKKTIFHGVYLYDHFAEAHSISKHQIHLVALVCLNLAMKLEESEATQPRLNAIRIRLPGSTDFSPALFVETERYVLEHFHWRLMYPTIMNFLEFFLLFALDPNINVSVRDFNNNMNHRLPIDGVLRDHWRVASKSAIPIDQSPSTIALGGEKTQRFNRMMEVIDALLNYTLAEPSKQFYPSMLAASCILIGREAIGLPRWSTELQSVTAYTQVSVEKCVNRYFQKAIKALKLDKKETCIAM